MLENLLSNDFSNNFYKLKRPQRFQQLVDLLKASENDEQFLNMLKSDFLLCQSINAQYIKYAPKCFSLSYLDKVKLILNGIDRIPKCKYE